ncbi:hypothetical protein [Candidatus Mycoplasma haematohominis]|uniref:hypothetical protein n=1 Tax=Candidatus Mycoplasma haematohominis TaxID=1494318 RepID=UPI001C0A6BFF|nr:hypothetical protein [Candidatus Mycoplasma haemohominis]
MNIALVIDDPARLDFVIYELLKDTRELDNLFGMHAYQGDYKGSLVKVFFIGSNKDSVALRTEDLFLFEDLDLIVNVGYCYCWHDSKRVHDGDHVLVTAVKCDSDYRSLLNLNDFQNKKSLELDKRL